MPELESVGVQLYMQRVCGSMQLQSVTVGPAGVCVVQLQSVWVSYTESVGPTMYALIALSLT